MNLKIFNFWKRKKAVAIINGGPLAPYLEGSVNIREMQDGSEVIIEVYNLPQYRPGTDNREPIGPHGFHIHEYGNCTIGDPENPFLAAGGHWNPTDQPHGNHAGDLPNIFSNNGQAWMKVYTNKFTPDQVRGKSIIIHENPDDLRSQPAGNAGRRLACGVIE